MNFPTALIFFCIFGSVAHADIIHLKNGKKIECSSAWEEGKDVKYKITSGTASIPQSMVLKIEKSQVKSTEPAIPEQAKPKPEPENRTDLKTKERLARFYTDRGMEFVEKKDFQSALQQLQKAHGYLQNETTTLNLAIVHYLLKDDWNAELNFREVLRRNPDNVNALNYLAEVHWRKEELDQARIYWERSLAVKEDAEVREKLNRLEKERIASADYEQTVSSHFLIKYDGGQAESALTMEISSYLEEAYKQLSDQYEIHPLEPFVVILYPRQQYFDVTDVPRWSAGANDGKIKLPIKGLSTMTDELKNVLTHELSHSFVDLKTLKNTPAWLQEGLAEYSEGRRLTAEGKQVLRSLVDSRTLPSLRKLERSFAANNAQTAALFYLQSMAFIEYLVDRHRFYQLNQFLERLSTRETLDEAFQNVYTVSLEDMENRWQTDLLLE